MNNITIELCAEDRARLDRLADVFEARIKQVEDILAKNYVATEEPEGQDTPQEPQNEPEMAERAEPEKEPAEVQEAPQAKEEPAVSVQELQKLVVDLCAKGKKDQVREIVNAYAAKVSDIPEDKRADVYAQLTALEG